MSPFLLCFCNAFMHRSLGVHFSKVRSLTLDTWEPELLKVSEGKLMYSNIQLKPVGLHLIYLTISVAVAQFYI